MPETNERPETKSLPEDAYTPLAPGAVYKPIVPAGAILPELTWRSVGWGVLLCIVFSVASAYSGLKVGQVMEAAIPISILAIGLARVYPRRSSLLENVIITSIGGAAGSVVAGAIFTLPALYILKLDPHPLQTIFICLAGGCLGVLFLIPLRRYFVRDMHGQFPYPEATAITEVLVTGEKGGSQARLLLQATAISGVYDFFVTTFQVWKEYVDFQFVPAMRALAERAQDRLQLRRHRLHPGPGIRHGSAQLDDPVRGRRAGELRARAADLDDRQPPAGRGLPGHRPDRQDDRERDLPAATCGSSGVGAIATAGIFGIIKSLRIVAGSFSIAARAFRHGEGGGLERTDRDIPVMSILLGVVLSALCVGIFFGSLSSTLADRGHGPADDPGVFVLLHLGRGQRHRHHGPQPGLGHDHADHHHFLGRAAALRVFGNRGHVLRDGDRGHGLHGARGFRPDHHRPEDRLLARLDARRAGEGEVPGRAGGGRG